MKNTFYRQSNRLVRLWFLHCRLEWQINWCHFASSPFSMVLSVRCEYSDDQIQGKRLLSKKITRIKSLVFVKPVHGRENPWLEYHWPFVDHCMHWIHLFDSFALHFRSNLYIQFLIFLSGQTRLVILSQIERDQFVSS